MDSSDREPSDALRETVANLRTPITQLERLLELLCAPLGALGILPREFCAHNTTPLSPIHQSEADRWIPTIQSTILQHVLPAWQVPLEQAGLGLVLDQYFCPQPADTADAKRVALHAYSTLLSPPITPYAIRMLARLVGSYPIDKLVGHIFARTDQVGKATLQWEVCVKAVVSVPAKVANAAGSAMDSIPPELEYKYVAGIHLKLQI